MKDKIKTLQREIAKAIQEARTPTALDEVQNTYFGRKGKLTMILRAVRDLPEKDRPSIGKIVNSAKLDLESRLNERKAMLEGQGSSLDEEWADVTEPGIRPPEGHLHLVTHAIREITSIFDTIGFTRVRYPEVDWDWYAFESLNMPADHPARDEWETFFMDAPPGKKGKMVLTPHTSNSQVREMERGEFPIRMIDIAKCYRRQSDVTHVPMFHQFEGLYVDKDVSIAHLRGILDYFVKAFFGPDRKTRLRPFHFRFTEPSFEIDVSCDACGGSGKNEQGEKCRMCKRGWLELGGAGMVHPNVLSAGGIDSTEYSGLAFGWGVERTYMMKEGLKVDDIRTLYRNDIRFLKQF
ncbi:MAG: phenylalanine--tRNA ligase subunit alpha [bacterium]|nr:phenylalanine--tRNA ligase subunit alpha [bacterium]